MQQPQSSLDGANAATLVPQTMQAPTQLNPYKMGNQTQALQIGGMATGQAVNKSAQNPSNKYASGGDVPPPPSGDDIDAKLASFKADPALLNTTTKAVADEKMLKDQPKDKPSDGKFHDPVSKSDQETLDMFDDTLKGIDAGEYQKKAKGGDIHETIKNMSLQDIIKLLASHPEVGGALGGPGKGMATGGAVKPNMKSEARSHGLGLLNMNADVQGYASGGKVPNKPVPTYTAQPPAGAVESVGMAAGGDLESDDITGYGPDGSPIVQNADGSTQYGDINQLLDRPKSAPTIGTGQTPMTGVSKNAANSVAGATPANAMAKGGAEDPPPGSLSKEVADDIPAKLSQGEFVFSADVVRFYGLRLLNTMMEHARQELKGMENEGNIRSPGDGKDNAILSKDQGTLGQFVQDQKPNMNAYDQDGGNSNEPDDQGQDEITGIIKECMGGGMATGGGVAEEDFAQGGEVDSSYGNDTDYGNSNMVSSHPQGGSGLMDYAKGGIVTSTSSSLTPKKLSTNVPTSKVALAKPQASQMPKIKAAKPISLPKMNDGGMLVKNMVPSQGIVGA